MLAKNSEMDGKSVNKATKRVLTVLAAFVGSQEPLGVGELSRRLDMSRNMVHRALVTLHQEGLLFKIEGLGRYVLNYNVAQLKNAARPIPTFKDIARPYMEAVAEELGESVGLMARSGDFQTVIDGVEAPGHYGLRVKIGHVVPLHMSSGSRAILSSLDDEDIQAYIDRNSPLVQRTPNSLSSGKAIWEDVMNVRDRGFAFSAGDYSPNTAGMGHVILDIDGRPHGALVLAGPIQRITDEWALEASERIAPLLTELRRVAALYEVV